MNTSRTRGVRRWLRRLRRFWRRRLRSWWRNVEWLFLAAASVAAIVLGMVGFQLHAQSQAESLTTLDVLYRTLQLFVLESGAVSGWVPWQLEIARLLAPAVSAYAALLAIVALFGEQLSAMGLRIKRGHTVICGLGEKGYRLARSFTLAGESVVVVEQDESNPYIENCRNLGITVLTGDASHVPQLEQARVHRAARILAVCGDDAENADIAIQVDRVLQKTGGNGSDEKVVCTTHVTDPKLWHQLGGRDLLLQPSPAYRLQFFSVYESGARAMIADDKCFGDDVDVSPDGKPHVLVIGVGLLGMGVVARTARRWWMRRGIVSGDGLSRTMRPQDRFSMTIVDLKANEKLALLIGRHPKLPSACRIDAVEIDVRSSAFEREEFLEHVFRPGSRCSVYICFDNEQLALATALQLRETHRHASADVVVRMSREEGLATVLEADSGDDSFQLRAFPLLKHSCTAEVAASGVNEIIARAFHAEYVRRCRANGQTPATNPSLVDWHDLPEDLRESNRDEADHVTEKLRAANCRLVRLQDWDADLFQFDDAVVDQLARMEHERWLAERRRKRWTQGRPKDPGRRIHPYLMPLEDMSDEEREMVLDYNRASVTALPRVLAEVDLQIAPK